MNEIAMFVGYGIISYFGLLIALYLIYLPLLALTQKFESPVLELPLVVLLIFIKTVGAPLVLLAKLVPTFN